MQQILERLADAVWGVPCMALLLLVGVLATAATKGVQFRKLGESIRHVWHSIRRPPGEGVSSFQAVCTALAATVGTGNVAGVAGAIALGGPGAVFWMWVSAFLGMATKYVEVVLALRHRVTDENGRWRGGPMYYIREAVGKRWRWLSAVFAFFAVLASIGMGNMTQIHTIATAVVEAAARYVPRWEPHHVALVTGGAAAAVTALVTLGGAKRIGSVMETMVPAMAGLYLFAAGSVILFHGSRLPEAFRMILTGALQPGAIAGVTFWQAVRWGVSRGVFSNEAGLGSAPIAHAAAEARPEEQGLMGIFEVFADTIVLCTLTALAILVSGVPIPYGQTAGAELASAALETVLGGWASGLLAVCLSLLALATVISWGMYGSQCAGYLWGNKGSFWYRIAYIFFVLAGATMELSTVWICADICNGLMAIPNLIALISLLALKKVMKE